MIGVDVSLGGGVRARGKQSGAAKQNGEEQAGRTWHRELRRWTGIVANDPG
jgi:hypothetical protein